MKYAILFSLLLSIFVAPEGAFADDPYAEQTIQDALKSSGVSLSVTEKALNRLGDHAAVGLTRVLANTPVAQPEQLRTILSILRDAFAVPSIISSDADREPKTTLFVLEFLRLQPSAQKLGAQIDETKAFILRRLKETSAQQ